MLFIVAKFYLSYYGTHGGNLVKDLQPLAVILIGLAAVSIAFRNHWKTLGHRITYRETIFSPGGEKNLSDMPYIRNITLYNRKNKVEIIDKILLRSEELKYTVLVDFERSPRVLKEYSTTLIELDPVTIWGKGSEGKNLKITEFTTSLQGSEAVIKKLKGEVHPIFYATSYNYSVNKRVNRNIIAVTPDGWLPIKVEKIDWRAYGSVILPIRNTEGLSAIYQYTMRQENEKIICNASVIQVTELTLGKSEAGNSPSSQKIKVFLHNKLKRYSFVDCLEKNREFDAYTFFPRGAEKFEEEWEIYYNNEKEKIKKSIIDQFAKSKKGMKKYKKEILDKTKIALEDFFYRKTANLFDKPELPKMSSEITSKIFFLLYVNSFAEYPIVKKRHTLFETAFYPIKEINPCFEEIEESIFSKMRRKIFRKTPTTFQETQEQAKEQNKSK